MLGPSGPPGVELRRIASNRLLPKSCSSNRRPKPLETTDPRLQERAHPPRRAGTAYAAVFIQPRGGRNLPLARDRRAGIVVRRCAMVIEASSVPPILPSSVAAGVPLRKRVGGCRIETVARIASTKTSDGPRG